MIVLFWFVTIIILWIPSLFLGMSGRTKLNLFLNKKAGEINLGGSKTYKC